MKKNNWKTSTIVLGIFTLLLISILFFQYSNGIKEEQNNNNNVLTEEQRSSLVCPFRCIDLGYSYGKYCRGINKCVCEK
ncbi:MAG: hypothetical protein IMZ60_00425 [Actinobacteria bacterium]|nr:hypothetical protein [Actinomycetota bacterium]